MPVAERKVGAAVWCREVVPGRRDVRWYDYVVVSETSRSWVVESCGRRKKIPKKEDPNQITVAWSLEELRRAKAIDALTNWLDGAEYKIADQLRLAMRTRSIKVPDIRSVFVLIGFPTEKLDELLAECAPRGPDDAE